MSLTAHVSHSTEFLTGLRDHFVELLNEEHPATVKVLAAVRSGDWRPDPKARSAAEIMWHIATSEVWFLRSIADGKFEGGDDGPTPSSLHEIVSYYEKGYAEQIARVAKLTPAQLAANVSFYGMVNANYRYLDFCLRHSIHHRAQLATYLRPLGGKVPSIYGGSADEKWEGPTSA
jgi:uncharacterized damage-inducible protein DinB